MSRVIIFDTETTGRDPLLGDRIVELGCVELVGFSQLGATFHRYINPEREMDAEVIGVHGLTNEFLRDKPRFGDTSVGEAFLAFVGDAILVAHNAEFDRKFLNAELHRLGHAPFGPERFVDTLAMARKRFPGASNSLDALCRRFNISLESRDKHGALIDARLLAEVYIELQGGREQSLGLEDLGAKTRRRKAPERGIEHKSRARPGPAPILLTPEELAAHEAFIAALGPEALWKKLE